MIYFFFFLANISNPSVSTLLHIVTILRLLAFPNIRRSDLHEFSFHFNTHNLTFQCNMTMLCQITITMNRIVISQRARRVDIFILMNEKQDRENN